MTATLAGPVGVIGWDISDDEWRARRSEGFGGSDIAAILGFSTHRTPWEVWAEKTGVRTWADKESQVADLGTALEPWLLDQAAIRLDQQVRQPKFRTYAHPDHSWRRCSPDGLTDTGIVECKTAGLMSFRAPVGWDDGATPLGYEFQCRWTLHVMDRPRIDLVGLVAGMGLVHRTIVRDMAVERDMVDQVTDWHRTHIVEGVEPPIGPGDNEALARLYPRSDGTVVDLSDTDAYELQAAYLAARAEESAAKQRKEAAGAALKALIGAHDSATVEDHLIATWSNKKGAVDWPALVADLVSTHSIPAPNPDVYRKPSTRSLNVKE
ncbi:YqaJ viral recombinase family protein [Polymorphospora lycopeni]|uniref:Lambda-exonuclease family protein n=1 Tax=Polymorphospora lycopeni TaxID=3140240 RepID=A0ABV5CKP4_9ACTN